MKYGYADRIAEPRARAAETVSHPSRKRTVRAADTTPTLENWTMQETTPSNDIRTVSNRRPRDREHLTPDEVAELISAARKRRWGIRDAALLTTMYVHGLRASEAIRLRWHAYDLNHATITIVRAKGGVSGTHPMSGNELRLMRALQREVAARGPMDYVFCSEREAPLTVRGLQALIARIADRTSLKHLNVHPHMLRHSAGYKLVNQGTDIRLIQSYLGHRSINSTVRYTALSETAFAGLWE
jgi:site-specific recombinase XerD